jgi:hypothetical protein
MEAKIVKSTDDSTGTYVVEAGTYGNKFLPTRNIRGGNEVVDTTAAYRGLPQDIVKSGGIDKFDRPTRESQYAKIADDAGQGVGKRFIPKGRK